MQSTQETWIGPDGKTHTAYPERIKDEFDVFHAPLDLVEIISTRNQDEIAKRLKESM